MNALPRAACACLFAAAIAPAQFRDLATPQDGSRLYFISALRQRGTTQNLYPKIFKLDAAGVSLVLEPPAPGPVPYDWFTIGPLETASDGSWVLYGKQRNCIGGSSCFLNEQRTAVMLSAGSEQAVGANARFSRDGRWMLTYSSPNVMIRVFERTDRRTGQKTDLRQAPAPAVAPSVSASGAVLIPAYDALSLWDNGTLKRLAGRAVAATMDDRAATVIYETPGARLRVVYTATGLEGPLGSDERENRAPFISGDGQWALYLSLCYNGPQVFFSHPDGSNWKQLTDEPGGIARAVLSGDGRVAWAVTNSGAILHIDTMAGLVEERIARTPRIASFTPGARGSAAEITGASLAPAEAIADWPLRESLAGVEVRAAGRRMLPQYVSPERILFQIPWETPEGETELSVTGGGPDFDPAVPYTIRGSDPHVAVLGTCASQDCIEPIAVHEDFGSLVTQQNPARPGEVVHLYATGLGPVDQPVPSGTPAPVSPLARTTMPWEWLWSIRGDTRAEVLFAGLAPGLAGWYQIDVRAPADADSFYVPFWVKLSPPDGSWARWSLGYIPVLQ